MNSLFSEKVKELVRPEDRFPFLLQGAQWHLEGPFLRMTVGGGLFYFTKLEGPRLYAHLTGWKLILGPGEGIWQGRVKETIPWRKRVREYCPKEHWGRKKNYYHRDAVLSKKKQFMLMFSSDLHPGILVYLKLIETWIK